MTINSAMLAGVSGLVANSSALAAISDNIANVNTVGYKDAETDFEDIVTGASTTGSYNAGGVLADTTQLVTQQGNLQQTSSNTDLGISGQGFFVVANNAANSTTAARSFTRAGSFTVDSQGYLENSAGLYLQGWPVNSDGSVSIDPSNLNALQSINVGSVGGAVSATTQVSLNANLDSNQAVSAAATAASASPPTTGAYSASTNSMASYVASGGTSGVEPDFTIPIPVSDTQGGQRTLQLELLKSAQPNQWYAELVASPPDSVQTGSSLSDGQVATGTLQFNADGSINMADSTLFGGSTTPSLSFGASTSTGLTGDQVAWASDLGIGAQTISFNIATPPGGLTQDNSDSVIQSTETNGTQFGNLTNVDIDANGFVTAVYDNGVSRQIAQVALATFPNPDGLKAISGDAYQVSTTSGSFNLKAAGSGGAGTLSPSTLESSTVDLSSEFAGLITTQEAYSASAKIITTADQMLQSLIDIKQ